MTIAAIGAGVAAGALGGGLAVTVLAPLTAANNFLGSYFFGSGMILGERQMYQDDWIKIKKRLDAGESFLVILEEVMKPNTQAVMQMAKQTVIAVSEEWNKIVLAYIGSLSQELLNAIGLGGDVLKDFLTPPPSVEPPRDPSQEPGHSDVGKRPHTHGDDSGVSSFLAPKPITEPIRIRRVIVPPKTIQNKLNPIWIKAVKVMSDVLQQYVVAIDALFKQYKACRAENAGRQLDSVCRRRPQFQLMLKTTDKRNALTKQLADFVRRYPSSGYNYSNVTSHNT